jgi:amicyanin
MSPWKWMALAVTAVPALLLGASSPAWSQRGGGPQIEIKAHGFDIPELTVQPGTTVTWINHDDDPHTVTSTQNVFRSPGIDTDETYSYTFTKPGTYEYFCTLHPLMTGKVVVRSGS